MSGGDQAGDVIDARTGQPLLTLRANHFGNWLGSIAFSPDGKRLASTNGESDAYIWDAASGQKLFTLNGHSNWIGDLAYCLDGSRLATIGYDGYVKMWDPASGKELFSVQTFTEIVPTTSNLSIDFSPDSARFATAGGLQPKVWDARTGNLLLTLPAQDGDVYSIAFSPDGKHLVIGGQGGFASVWDAASGQKITDLTGHAGSVNAILFSRDGKQVISGSVDGTVKIWDAASGQEQLTLTRQPTQITGLSLSPDGRRLAVSSFDGAVRVYLLNVNDLVQLAEQRLTRWFTPQECRDFLHTDTCPPKP
jgi:WD40 repeat protein